MERMEHGNEGVEVKEKLLSGVALLYIRGKWGIRRNAVVPNASSILTSDGKVREAYRPRLEFHGRDGMLQRLIHELNIANKQKPNPFPRAQMVQSPGLQDNFHGLSITPCYM